MPLQLVNELDDATHYLPDTEEVFRRRYRAASYLVHHSACAWGAETREHLQLYVPYARSMFVTKKKTLFACSLCLVCVLRVVTHSMCVSPRHAARRFQETHTHTRPATRQDTSFHSQPTRPPFLARRLPLLAT